LIRSGQARWKIRRTKPKVVVAAAEMWPRLVFDFEGKATVKEYLRKPGVYVLLRNDEPYYVGKTKNKLFSRIRSHACKTCDRYYHFWNYLSAFVVPNAKHRDEIEGILIAAMPTANSASPKIKKIPLPKLEGQPGTYALLLESANNAEIRIGRLGDLHLLPGFCIYVGSAFGPGGVHARVNHHLLVSLLPRLHIDYLRPRTTLEEVWLRHCRKHREHLWARLLSSMPGVSVPMPGFGSSDCDCSAHLFFFRSQAVRVQIREALSPVEQRIVRNDIT
jgi:Uri superfamily endonuclease